MVLYYLFAARLVKVFCMSIYSFPLWSSLLDACAKTAKPEVDCPSYWLAWLARQDQEIFKHHNSKVHFEYSLSYGPDCTFCIWLLEDFSFAHKFPVSEVCFLVHCIFFIAFLPSKWYVLILWLQTRSTVSFRPGQINLPLFPAFPSSIVMSPDSMPWMLSVFVNSLNASQFCLYLSPLQEAFSSSLLSAVKETIYIRDVDIFLRPLFHSALCSPLHNDARVGSNNYIAIYVVTLLSRLNLSVVLCLILTAAFRAIYRFLRHWWGRSGIPFSRIFHSLPGLHSRAVFSSIVKVHTENIWFLSKIYWCWAMDPCSNRKAFGKSFQFMYCWSLATNDFEHHPASMRIPHW